MTSSTVRCGACGATNPKESIVCVSCGALLAAYETPSGASIEYSPIAREQEEPETAKPLVAVPIVDDAASTKEEALADDLLILETPERTNDEVEELPVEQEPRASIATNQRSNPFSTTATIEPAKPDPLVSPVTPRRSTAANEDSFVAAQSERTIPPRTPIAPEPISTLLARTFPVRSTKARMARSGSVSRIQSASAAKLILWGAMAMLSSCVVAGLGTSFDGGGCFVGLGVLAGMFSFGLIVAGIARAAGHYPQQK